MTNTPMDTTDAPRVHDCDLLVVGTGAGGLSTAVTAAIAGLDVLVVEKAPVFGGTTARSGGWLWIPGNRHARDAGFQDSKEEARTYLQHEAGNHFDPDRVDAFLDAGPEMVDFFEKNTSVRFVLGPTFADYHPDAPGGKDGGRSICAEPFDARGLGGNVKNLRPPLREITFLGMMIGSGKELLHFFNVTRSPVSMAFVARLLARYGSDRLLHGRGMRLTNGNALAGRLAKSAFDLGVPIWLSSPAKELLVEDGRVVGAVIAKPDGEVRVRARRGVVLAAGGFPWDLDRRRRLFPHAPTGREHYTPAPETNTGDGLRLGEAVGGRGQSELPNAAAWVPVSQVPRRDGSFGVFPHFVDRSKPGVIAVNRHGRRFVNEANSYHDFVQAMRASYDASDPGEVCGWFVCDHKTIRRYGLGFAKPAPLPLRPYLKSGYLVRGDTPEELARNAGFDPAAFRATLDAFNGPARRGEDPEFHKGSTSYNRSLGDPDHQPNPCVAPVEQGPFYAVKVVVGDLGTFAGLRTDRYARVLRAQDGSPIDGLYAVGNDMGSIMGGNYPGGGITLGPAMTFGYIAARHAAGRIG
ncbi:FAD-dependent oxidoreductase [Arenibaculum sp.]|uniref:FAD-dependent oxidoreductase n=1 Tax=Arenibaculum sp. TaxID=2865862 RepID=UPI002E1326BA|nr:FAD-dependent oxidoreductase [Arenibaculum sp.]